MILKTVAKHHEDVYDVLMTLMISNYNCIPKVLYYNHASSFLDKIEHKNAVVILEKTPFSDKAMDKILSSEADMELQFNNDIYSQFLCKFPTEINYVKNTLIYPANEKHLSKYAAQRMYLVNETPDVYHKFTLPFIEEQAVHLQVKYTV